MKFFIFFFYTAHLLTEISARWLLTTPMQSELRSKAKDNATSQILKVVETIELINSASKDHGRNIAHFGGYGGFHSKHVSRRFELPALEVKNPLAPKEDVKETQLEMAETVRYHVIDNPQVLEEYINKQKKKKNSERYLMRKKTSSVIDNQSLEAKYFNAGDDKLKSYRKNPSLEVGSHNILNTSDTLIQSSHHTKNSNLELDGVQEHTSVEPTYPPALADDDEGNEIKLFRITEKENNPIMYKKNHVVSAKIYNTNYFEKKTGIKARGIKHKVSVHADTAHTDDLHKTGPNKLELQPLHNENDNNNYQVTKKGKNKEFDYTRNVRMTTDNLNPKNNDYVKSEGEKERKDIQTQQTSMNKNEIKHTTPVYITSRKYKKKSSQEREGGHLIYPQQDINENSHRHHKMKDEKIDSYDKEVKEDKKRNDKGNSEKEMDLNNSHNQRYHDNGNESDKVEYEWNKRHLQYDNKDNSNNDNQRDSNDDEWAMKHYDPVKKENNWNKRDNKFNKKDSRILRDRKLKVRESMESDIEKQDAWYLRNERSSDVAW